MKMCLSVKIAMIITHSHTHTKKKEYFGETIENYKKREKKKIYDPGISNQQKPVKGPLE